MARFISIKVEYPDPDDETGEAALKEKVYFFSPLKIQYLKEFKDVIVGLEKKGLEDEEKIKADPTYVPDQFSEMDEIGKLLFKLVKVKHKKMEMEEFESTFSVGDYAELMRQLSPSDLS